MRAKIVRIERVIRAWDDPKTPHYRIRCFRPRGQRHWETHSSSREFTTLSALIHDWRVYGPSFVAPKEER